MRISNATPKAVKYACLRFHYAKAVPATKYAYNVFNGADEWCGVIVYSSGASPQIGTPYGLCQGEILELVRVALNGKQEATSQAVAMTLRQLHHDAPHVKMLVSYADTEQGHLGIIYQATNWIYIGVSKGHAYYIVNGKRMHSKSVDAQGWRQSEKWLKEHVDKNAKVIRGGDKHKYLFFFDKMLRKKWLQYARPYPKKEDENG